MTRRLALTLAALMAPGAALACSPVLFTPSETPVYGEGCQIVTYVDEIRAVGLSEVVNPGHGLVRQDIFDGNGCYWEADLLVQDCAAGQMLVIGPDNRDLMSEPQQTGIDRLVAAMDAGGVTLDQLEAMARAEGYAATLRLATGTRLSVNGHGVPSNCACETVSTAPSGG